MDPKIFKSKKISNLVNRLTSRVIEKQSVVIHRISGNEAEQRSYYRLLCNKNMDISTYQNYMYADCSRQVESDGHYLVFQDTTQPNLEAHRKHIKDPIGLGVIGDAKSLGFFLHASLVVNSLSGQCIGYSDVQVFHRPADKVAKKTRNYKTQPIEEKESYRWISSCISSTSILSPARITVVGDRESDISELFLRRGNADLLIRNRDNRRLEEGKLYEYLNSQAVSGSYSLKIEGDWRQNKPSRMAQIEVRFTKVHLLPSTISKTKIPVYAVEAREVGNDSCKSKVLWRLLTTHEVSNFEQACEIIRWYAMRWNIELVFRLIKLQGFNVEALGLEKGKSIILMTLIALFAASKIMLLHRASKELEPIPIKQTFSDEQIQCLTIINKKHEGKTPKQKNNYQPNSIQWCYWIFARMGGWKPHEKNAGVISLTRGWADFQQVFYGWKLAKEFVS